MEETAPSEFNPDDYYFGDVRMPKPKKPKVHTLTEIFSKATPATNPHKSPKRKETKTKKGTPTLMQFFTRTPKNSNDNNNNNSDNKRSRTDNKILSPSKHRTRVALATIDNQQPPTNKERKEGQETAHATAATTTSKSSTTATQTATTIAATTKYIQLPPDVVTLSKTINTDNYNNADESLWEVPCFIKLGDDNNSNSNCSNNNEYKLTQHGAIHLAFNVGNSNSSNSSNKNNSSKRGSHGTVTTPQKRTRKAPTILPPGSGLNKANQIFLSPTINASKTGNNLILWSD